MADGVVNTALSERFRTSSSGESFTISSATKPDGTSWAGPTITHLGNGQYSAAFTPDQEGVYLATITGNTSGEVFSGAWDIEDTADPMLLRSAPVDDTVYLIPGDDYMAEDGRALQWELVNVADLTGATVTLSLKRGATVVVSQTGTVSNEGQATQYVTVDLSSEQTALIRGGNYTVVADLASGNTETLARGRVKVN